MKNIMKIIIALFTSVSLISSVSAGELTVTGNAKATYNILSGDVNQGKGIGIANEFDLGATGELDNGWSWNYQVQFDPGNTAASSGGSNGQVDDSRLTLTTDYGTLGIFVSEGGLDTDNSASQSVYGRPTDIGVSSGIQDSFDIGSYNNIQLHTPAGLLPFGTSVKFAYATGDDTTINAGNAGGAQQDIYGTGAQQLQITASPIDGLSIGADYFEQNGAGDGASQVVQNGESGSIFASYATGPVSVGYQVAEINTGTAGTASTEVDAYSVAFNVNDNLAISYGRYDKELQSIAGSTSVTEENSGISAAYTTGAATLRVTANEAKNAGNVTGVESEHTEISLVLAF